MIQMLTYCGTEEKLKGSNLCLNTIHDAKSLDEFEINIVDLSDERFWRYKGGQSNAIDCKDDFRSLSSMIANSKNTRVCILFPQNLTYSYNTAFDKNFWSGCELKNMINRMQEFLSVIYIPIKSLEIVYENTSTQLCNRKATASFYFNGIEENVLTKSILSGKATTIDFGIILSTLKIENYDDVIALLREIGLIRDKEDVPEWMKEVQMFDDEKQIDIIRESNIVISEVNQKISNAMAILDKNSEYKSILYTNGDELVNIVFQILENMLDCDLSDFQDVKKEDFLFKLDGHYFIGEIKGVNHNVKNENVSQLDVHYQSFKDENPEIGDTDISAILIINHQKNKPIFEREPVHENQIKLAKRNGSLIIETMTLLKMFEKYTNQSMSREQCVNLLKENTGLLSL